MSAAKAVASWLLLKYPGAKLFCRDTLDYAPAFVKKSVAGSYLLMARKFPGLWRRIYRHTDSGAGMPGAFWKGVHTLLADRYVGNLAADLEAFDPSAVVSTHFMGMASLLDSWKRAAPVYFVNTDFGSHALQLAPGFDGFFVADGKSAESHRSALFAAAGARRIAVRDFGIPIAPEFAKPPARSEARARLEMDPGAKIVLLSGGGIGAGPIEEIADSLANRPALQINVVCGNNGKLYSRLRGKYRNMPHFRVEGFVDDMPCRYAACDIAVIKPGGLSVAEASAAGAAFLLTPPLYGLERSNSDYMLAHGASLMASEKGGAGKQIEDLINSPDKLDEMRSKARLAARPYAARDIIDSITGDLELN